METIKLPEGVWDGEPHQVRIETTNVGNGREGLVGRYQATRVLVDEREVANTWRLGLAFELGAVEV